MRVKAPLPIRLPKPAAIAPSGRKETSRPRDLAALSVVGAAGPEVLQEERKPRCTASLSLAGSPSSPEDTRLAPRTRAQLSLPPAQSSGAKRAGLGSRAASAPALRRVLQLGTTAQPDPAGGCLC